MPRRTVCALIALLVSASAFSQGPGLDKLPPAEKLAALLQQFGRFQKGLKTLQADFVQTRKSSLLAHESVSRGRLFFEAPDRIRWEYGSPLRMTVLIANGVAITYRPEEKRAERVEVGRMQQRVFHFLSAGDPIDELKRYFSITFKDPGPPGNYELILDPTSHHIRKRLESLSIEIDRTRLLPVGVSWVQHDGDSLSYAFSHIVVDEKLPSGIFTLDLPPDVHVVELRLGAGE